MPFEYHQKVLFKYCDPAGLVFYPRYFEMINDCVEEFFDQVLQWPFETMLKTSGAPTVSTTTEFTAPSRHGDHLLLTLMVEKLGNASMSLKIQAHCGQELRLTNQTTLVCVDDTGSPVSWPDVVRSAIEVNT